MLEHSDIAIIGFGFSGAMVLYHLVHLSDRPLKITLFEKKNEPALGIAYKTQDPCHLLNVPISRMSALPEDENHFFNWLKENEAVWRKIDPSFQNLIIDRESFFPRMIYGMYLQWLWQKTVALACSKSISINLEKTLVKSIDFQNHRFIINQKFSAEKVVLALGLSENRSFFHFSHPQYNEAGWNFDFSNLKKWNKDTQIFLIGSGLTMLDAIASLELKGYQGNYFALSKDGKLPEMHQKLPHNPPSFLDNNSPPKKALALLKKIRASIAKAKELGYDWRCVFQELRSSVENFWSALPSEEKKKMVRLFPIWNRHRHRVPQQYEKILETLKINNRFEIVAGRIQKIEEIDGKIKVTYQKKGDPEIKTLFSDYIINCTGPEYNILKTENPLIKNLLHNNLAEPNDLGTGLALINEIYVKGKAQDRFFLIGHLAFGERIETVAVPELKHDVKKIARLLLKK